MRYTKLSFEGLVEELENPDIKNWESLLTTEMCNLLTEGGQEGKKAEAFLRDWLKSKNSIRRLIAFRYLEALECLDAQTFDELEEFKRKPVNAGLIKEANRLIQEGGVIRIAQ